MRNVTADPSLETYRHVWIPYIYFGWDSKLKTFRCESVASCRWPVLHMQRQSEARSREYELTAEDRGTDCRLSHREGPRSCVHLCWATNTATDTGSQTDSAPLVSWSPVPFLRCKVFGGHRQHTGLGSFESGWWSSSCVFLWSFL